MNNRMRILLDILKAKGNCIAIVCKTCPLYTGCGFNMFDNSYHYERALELFLTEFGEIEMVENLLDVS